MTQEYKIKCFDYIKKHTTIKVVAVIIVIFFIISLFVLAYVPWQQTAYGEGKVIALSPNEREQNVIAPISGRLGKWHVHDGSYVKKGEIIVDLLDIDPNLLVRLKNEKQAILLQQKAAKLALDTAKINVNRQQRLFEEGISSRRNYENARFEHIKYESQLAAIQIELTKINVKIARQKSQQVRAPLSGTIIRRMAGQESVLVNQGSVLAVLIPETTSRVATLWLLGNDIPLIRVGQHVRLQFEGWPAIQFSGWPSVAVGTFGGTVKVIDPTDNGRGKFRILVVPDKKNDWPGPKFLRQGIRVNGWVLLNRVHLWYELWRRFNGFPPVVDTPHDAVMSNQP